MNFVHRLLGKWRERTDPPTLRTLSPRFEEAEHGYYADALFAQLVRVGAEAPRNIALTGHYGSGKSSVLVGVQTRLNSRRRYLRRQRGKAVNVSLSSLGTDEPPTARIDEDGAPSALTNLIQKEIVKQLLYRARPRRMRGSRFRRLDVFHPVPVASWSLVLASAVVTVGLLFGLRDRISRALPTSWASSGDWVSWVVAGAMVVVLAALGWSAARTLHNRVRIGDASAGPVKVSLKDDTSSFFDAYLDELVYFFQASRTSVVIFEDLDRFDDPHIFESLRELNTVLGNAEQIRYRPVRFVYAIKDSIFETLADADADNKAAAPALPATRSTSQTAQEDAARRTATRNRTKFFDLVVPVVPFISRSNARELVRGEFRGAGVGEDLMDMIAPYLTDMRLLHNIRNEFEVFASQILPPRGLDGLDRDQLLAMLVYKNLHLADFEAIREGESTLDELHQLYRDAIDDAVSTAEGEAHAARVALNNLEAAPRRAAQAAERLRWAIALLNAAISYPVTQMSVGTETFTLDRLDEPQFWQAWAESGNRLDLLNPYSSVVGQVSREDALLILGVELTADLWDQDQRSTLDERERTATSRATVLMDATFAQMLADDSILIPHGETHVPLLEIAEERLDELAVLLLVNGYLLDENYTLYVARFHIGTLSLQAMNFILHNVQRDRRDQRLRFDDAGDIDKIIAAESRRFLHGQAVFNIQVFDHLLPDRTDQLDSALTTLTDGSPVSEQFVDAYLKSGAHPDLLLHALAPRWPEIFTYLATEGRLSTNSLMHFSDVAARAASAHVEYVSNQEARSVIMELTAQGDAFTNPTNSGDPRVLLELLRRFDLTITDLSVLTDDVRKHVVDASRYTITARNLRAATERDAIRLNDLWLDQIVFTHVRDHLAAYLDETLEPADAALTDEGPWPEIVREIAHPELAMLHRVLDRSTLEVRADSLAELDSSTWPAFARAGRFAATASNLARYVDTLGVDEDLRAFLGLAHDDVDVDLDAPESAALALELVNQAALPPDRLVPLVQELTRTPFTTDELTPAAMPIVPRLVHAGLLPDDRSTFELLADQPWALQRELIVTSQSFTTYLPELVLHSDQVREFATGVEVPDRVKAALLDVLPAFAPHLDARAATALARWAADYERVLTPSEMTLLAGAGADRGTVLAALAGQVGTLTHADIAAVLRAAGGPLSRLSDMDAGEHLDLPASNQVRAVLDRLKALGAALTYRTSRDGGTIGVHRRS
jgi:hypothetical protein